MKGSTISAAGRPCPVCSSPAGAPFHIAAQAPVTCASVFADPSAALAVPSGEINLAACGGCGFVFNTTFDAALGEVGARYESSQAASPHFMAYVRSLAHEWVQRHGLRGRVVIEVGCGSGDFLSLLLEQQIATAIGVDPLAQPDRAPPFVQLISDCFDDRHARLQADALVCRHTLEHVPDVSAFLRSIHQWAAAGGDSRIVLFEVPDAERVFAERAFWDIYYEHCNYFTGQSAALAFERAGFQVLQLRRTYDDQYLIVEAEVRRPDQPPAPGPDAAAAQGAYDAFTRDVSRSIRGCERALHELAAQGAPLVLWQGASKTVGFLSALRNRDCIDSAIDLSPERQGKYLPGSGLPVHAPEELRRLRPRHIVLMNPVYLDEVRARVFALGVDAHVHSVNDLLRS